MGCFCFRPSHDSNNDIELEKGCRLLLLGLDDAGKTSNSKHYADNLAIIYTLKLGTAVDTIPTVGFNIENIVGIKDTHLTVVDVGGQQKIRSLWSHYFDGTDGVIFVLDAHNTARLPEARNELQLLAGHILLKGVPILILANKSDLPNARTEKELIEDLAIAAITDDNRQVKIQQCCALRGDGLIEGFMWIEEIYLEAKKAKATALHSHTRV